MHVSYFELWRPYMQSLFDDESIGLLRIERIYIAIMAAASRQSNYLFHFLKEEFQNDPEFKFSDEYQSWLENGFDSVPPKFQHLSVLNEKMATRPWDLHGRDILALTQNAKAFWRDSDLMYAIIIMAWFHSLAGFSFGVGISAELDAKQGHTVSYYCYCSYYYYYYYNLVPSSVCCA